MVITHNLKKFALTLAGLFIAIVAVILNLDQLYLMAAVLFLIPLASFILGRVLMRGLACRRAPVPPCGEGERATVTLTLVNEGRLPKMFLRASDTLPASLQAVGDAAPLILQLGAGESADVSYTVEAEKRGAYLLGPTLVSTTDPLGFYPQVQTIAASSEMLVYPAVLALRQMAAASGGTWGQREQDSTAARGGGLDFHGVRDYQPGDELRRVHWRTTARTGKLAVMEYTQGVASNILVALDLHASSYADTGEGRESALEYAVKMTAAACDYLLRQNHVLQVVLPALPPPALGDLLTLQDSAELPLLLEALARAEAVSTETLADALLRALPRVPTGATLFYITPAPGDEALAFALAQYAARGAPLFGYALDRASFAPAPRKWGGMAGRLAAKPTDNSIPAQGGSSVLWVRKGDDLVQAMEGGGYARR